MSPAYEKGCLLIVKNDLFSYKITNIEEYRGAGTLVKAGTPVILLGGPDTLPGLPKMYKYVWFIHKESKYVIELLSKDGLEDKFVIAKQ